MFYLLRSKRFRKHRRAAIGSALTFVVIGAVIAGLVWPSGLMRHYVSLTPATTPAPVTTVPGAPTTGAGNETTAPGATTAGGCHVGPRGDDHPDLRHPSSTG